MAFEIIWTINAKDDLKNIIQFLQSEWSYTIAEKFLLECEIKIDLIAHFPEIGIQSEKIKSIRRILISKHNALYYECNKNNIVLLNFFDTRQNPDKNLLK